MSEFAPTAADRQTVYVCWRFLLALRGIPGLTTPAEIDRAVAAGRIVPGTYPPLSTPRRLDGSAIPPTSPAPPGKRPTLKLIA
jgi:hypothetical protein